jgi:hypothetical protein
MIEIECGYKKAGLARIDKKIARKVYDRNLGIYFLAGQYREGKPGLAVFFKGNEQIEFDELLTKFVESTKGGQSFDYAQRKLKYYAQVVNLKFLGLI